MEFSDPLFSAYSLYLLIPQIYRVDRGKGAFLIYANSSKGLLFSECCFKDNKINVENFTLLHWLKNCKVYIIIHISTMKNHGWKLLKELQIRSHRNEIQPRTGFIPEPELFSRCSSVSICQIPTPQVCVVMTIMVGKGDSEREERVVLPSSMVSP